MKQYVAKVGGRFVYNDDIINLQDLALSYTALFVGRPNFIISGLEIVETSPGSPTREISSGFVWLNGHIRHFTGASGVTWGANGYFLVPNDSVESVRYAEMPTGEARHIFDVAGQTTTPALPVTQFIQIQNNLSAPRIENSWLGSMCVLLNPPTNRQTIARDIAIGGSLFVDGAVNGERLGLTTGTGALQRQFQIRPLTPDRLTMAQLLNGTEVHSIQFDRNGDIAFVIGGIEIMRVTSTGVVGTAFTGGSQGSSDIVISGGDVYRNTGDNEFAAVQFNRIGFNGGVGRFRNVEIFDGKGTRFARFTGADKQLFMEGSILVSTPTANSVTLRNSSFLTSEGSYVANVSFSDRNNFQCGLMGYVPSSLELFIRNFRGGGVTVSSAFSATGVISEQGTALSARYAPLGAFNTLQTTVSNLTLGAGLSEQNFTTVLKNKLDSIAEGTVAANQTGMRFINGATLFSTLQNYMVRASNLSDLTNTTTARTNLNVYSKDETYNRTGMDTRYMQKTANLSDLASKSTSRTNLDVYAKGETYSRDETWSRTEANSRFMPAINAGGWVACTNPDNTTGDFQVRAKQVGNLVTIQGVITCGQSTGSIWFRLPTSISPPSNYIGGVHYIGMGSTNYQRGLNWYCKWGERDFMVRNAYGSDVWTGLNITYMV